MDAIQQTSREYFRSLQIIYYVLIFGQLLFAFITIFLTYDQEVGLEEKGVTDIFIYIVPIFVIGGLIGSFLLFKNRLEASKREPDLIKKMVNYRSALIIRYSFLDGPSLFAIVIYLISYNIFFLALSGFIIIIFLLIKPTKERAINDLMLSPGEINTLNDPNAIVLKMKKY